MINILSAILLEILKDFLTYSEYNDIQRYLVPLFLLMLQYYLLFEYGGTMLFYCCYWILLHL
jgi:hypothetical protein